MRKFLQDAILRSAEKIKDRDRKAQTPTNFGRPTKCLFCDDHADVAVATDGHQAFVCAEHLGPLVVDWTTDRELTVVRL